MGGRAISSEDPRRPKAVDDSYNNVDFGDLGRPGRHQNVFDRRADRSRSVGAFSDRQRPNIDGNPQLSNDRTTDERLAQWFDTSVFSQPAAFTFGNSPRVLSLRSDGIHSMDLSLFKNFSLWEGAQLQFRAEFFNATNTPRFAQPDLNFGAVNFGRVTSQLNDPRQTQFGIKIIF